MKCLVEIAFYICCFISHSTKDIKAVIDSFLLKSKLSTTLLFGVTIYTQY